MQRCTFLLVFFLPTLAAANPPGTAAVVLAARAVASRIEVTVTPWLANTVRSCSKARLTRIRAASSLMPSHSPRIS